ncbi:MAG: hypothetical protein HYX75_07850 [Acidobacteria bacterium]|nr:hypothetical protein [Acidobacteriota bacterium]
MSSDGAQFARAGDSLADICRVCKTSRIHRVIVADQAGRALRVICGYCGSQHNYRGGETAERPVRPHGAERAVDKPAEIVAEQERRYPVSDVNASGGDSVDLELMLRRIIREETGLTPVPIAEKWRNGEMVLRPGKRELKEKNWPIETFFHKVVMVRNRLRVLEQQINGTSIPEDLKVKLQGYITGCYGSLTSFNILFAEEEDRFQGSSEES